jgi:two-component system, chemotaxis family, CheB/CheR fusion protein
MLEKEVSNPDPVDTAHPREFLVVGIGASAGGVQALQEFFANVPADSGMAYVVILHLSPDHDSRLAQVLQQTAAIPVTQVKGEVAVVPDHVYVVPPNNHLTITKGIIAVNTNIKTEERRAPVDIFFRSLATAYGPRAICVVLSGTGANGSMGLKRVKEMGGIALVQNPREAEFNEMPRNSIATELVDEILSVAEIPDKIIEYKKRMGTITIPVEAEKREESEQQALREIFTHLRVSTGHDFSNYKRATILRRIERRINVRDLPTLPAYAAFLHEHPEEIKALLKDLLISVTNFFRDKEAFDAIKEHVLPKILENKKQEDNVRIWIAGCATGEEVYSIAMLCAELTFGVLDAPKILLFATDIDDAAIAVAREGYYSLNDAADVSPERLRRFFVKEGDRFRVRKEIREMILFANHNFLKDPPFSHIDLVCCRNVLIYLNPVAQERAMETFHFALDIGRFLFLGSSESADGSTDLYSIFDREHHIYQSRQVAMRTYPVPESVPKFRFAEPTESSIHADLEKRIPETYSFGDLHQRLLEQYAPPSVIVNEDYDIMHLTDRAGRYLNVVGGRPTKSLLKLVKPELRLELRSALYQALQQKKTVEARGLAVTIDGKAETVNIHVKPALGDNDVAKGYLLVIFEQSEDQPRDEIILPSDDPVARHLEEELNRTKEQLRISIEQHEYKAEDLKASNEELQAMNEELRSAAEELETNKEELQSINEELRTVNQELKVKIEEISVSNNNLSNLINSADIATLFLDRSLRVAFFTSSASEIFNLIPTDYGRPLSDITSKLLYTGLSHDAETVLGKLQSVEKEVETIDGRAYIMRVLPYRTAEDRIGGVVITFFDISKLKAAEESLRQSEEYLRLLIESAKDYAIFTIDTDRRVNMWNTGAEAMMGFTESEIIGQSGDVIFVPEDRENGDPEKEVEKARTTGRAENERWHLRKDGSRFYGSGYVMPLKDKSGSLLGFVKIMRDMTQSKMTEEALRLSEERYRIALSSAEMGAWDWDLQADRMVWNDQTYTLLGINPDGEPKAGDYFLRFVHNEDVETVGAEIKAAVEEKGVFHHEFRIVVPATGEIRWLNGYGRTVARDGENASRMVGVIYDITHRKILEQQKDEFIGIASHELRTPVTSIKAYSEILHETFEEAKDKSSLDLVSKLDVQVDRLMNLIRALLDTTSIAENQLKIQKEELDLNELIKDRAESLQRLSAKHKLVVLPGILKPVQADKERIGQVLTNLISNAIKYSPNGGDVVISSVEVQNGVQVSVRDSGIGIPEDLQNRVFDRFFRVSNPRIHSFPGMGLGLYITAGIVHRHGGTISATSKPGEGSVFYFTLPYDKH